TVTNSPVVTSQVLPDGHWIAWITRETGRFEVYAQPFPPSGAKRQISEGGGNQPMWRKDSRELFFVSGERKLYAVGLRSGSALTFGAPQFLFEMRANITMIRNSYVPAPDGHRFLINMSLDSPDSPISVVLNWPEELKAKVPVK